jgi:adenylate cyclase
MIPPRVKIVLAPMTIEIERRFLVWDSRAALAGSAMKQWYRIRQGYFGRLNRLRVRVRTMIDASGERSSFLTLKGPRRGFCRDEHQRPLPFDQGEQWLLRLPPAQVIRKTRHLLHGDDGIVWAIDQFEGANAGLVIAEVELLHPRQPFEVPRWASEEITLNPRYGNSTLARYPINHPAVERVGKSGGNSSPFIPITTTQ